MNVSVRELKNHLSEYLRRASAGEEILVTSRNRPLARLVPVTQPRTGSEQEALAELQALPWVSPGDGHAPRGLGSPVHIRPGEKGLSDIVSEDRGS